MKGKFLPYIILALVFLSCTAKVYSWGNRIQGSEGSILLVEDFGTFNDPWAMVFLPDGNLLVSEKSGSLYLFNTKTQDKSAVEGIPSVAYGGQGGLGDVILHPQYIENGFIYLSYVEEDSYGIRGAVVIRAKLNIGPGKNELLNRETIWRQEPKTTGSGHFSHKLAFDTQGHLFITSGDRQKMTPAQSWTQNLGKIIRLNSDGSVPLDNPFQNKGELATTFWTLGHRNLLGIAFDADGQLWAHEMGPRHGDEFNLIAGGENYGWPLVSWGNHYSGEDIPDHNTRPDFHSPEEYWIPSIAPSGLIIYDGLLFPDWQGNAILGGLISESLIRVEISGKKATEKERFNMKKRIREVEQGPDGAIWILEDKTGAKLRRLTPATEN